MIDSEVEYQEYEKSEKNKRLGINTYQKMTDFEKYKQLFDETGVKNTTQLHAGKKYIQPDVGIYMLIEIVFDENGKFIELKAY